MFDAPNLSKAVLALYNPHADPFGVAAWQELFYASPEIKRAWIDHHFQWSAACKAAAADLHARGRNVVLDMTLFDVREDTSGETAECAIDYEISVMRPRGKSFRLDETDTEATFGRTMFLAGNPWRLADRVNDEIELREEAAAVPVASNIA
ncbi:MAG: hypothetical protein E5Y30_27125 [Mesorhizobium sp.]|nr:MAG: hypothetical protein E5Y30_27125 [Mesorhizobium sp.]